MSQKVTLPRRMDILKALTTSPPVQDHVLPGLPTASVGGLVSPGGMGKTLLLLQTAVALATGRPPFGGLFGIDASPDPAPAKVVLVVAEEGFDVMHQRLHDVVGSLLSQTHPLLDQDARDSIHSLLGKNLHLYPMAGATRLLIDGRDNTGDGLEILREMASDARLLIIDPLRQFHTGDENDSWAMTAVVQGLQSIATDRRCAVLAAHHTNKAATFNGQGDRAGAARGSAAFTDGVRWQLNLSPLDDQLSATYGISKDDLSSYVRLDLAKANYVAPQAPQVLRRGPGGVFEAVSREATTKVASKRRRTA